MGIIILVIAALAISFEYSAYEQDDIKKAYLINLASGIITSVLENGFQYFTLGNILMNVIASAIGTAVGKFAYNVTKSFTAFFLLSAAVQFVIAFLITYVMISLATI